MTMVCVLDTLSMCARVCMYAGGRVYAYVCVCTRVCAYVCQEQGCHSDERTLLSRLCIGNCSHRPVLHVTWAPTQHILKQHRKLACRANSLCHTARGKGGHEGEGDVEDGAT